MRIVTVGADEAESTQLAHVLRAAGHEVWGAPTEPAMVQLINDHGAHLVMLSAASQSASVIAMARAASITPARPHVLLLHGGLPDDFVAQVIDAGADGDVKKPLTPRYFAARIAAVRRRADEDRRTALGSLAPPVDWKPTRTEVGYVPTGAAEAVPGRVAPPVELVSRSSVWGGVLEHLRGAASRFLALDVSSAELPAEFEPQGLGATILLLSAATQLEVRLSLAVDPASAQSFAVHLFGGEGEDLAQEVLNELSNIFMGTMKTAFSTEAFAFTGGLPEVMEVQHVLRPGVPYRFQETALLTAGDARIVVYAGLRSRANVLLTPPALREGMVLAKDVINARGILLLNGGTRLSAHMVERLRANMAARQEIEVIAP